MRVLFVSHSFPLPGDPLSNVGGMQRVAVDLHAALADHPEVELHSLVLETAWADTTRRMVPFMARLLRDIPRAVRRHRIEVVLFSSAVTAALAVPLRGRLAALGALTAAIPVGRDVTLPGALYQRFVPRVLRSLDMVLPISRATAEACLARGARPERTEVVPCGIDPRRFPHRRDRGAARRALLQALQRSGAPVPADALLVCSVGRHQERKGFHWFVDRVLPLLPPDVFFLLGGEGPMTPAIRAAARERGVEERVRLLGRLPEPLLETLYCGADLFAMPNVPVPGDLEGFGVVMLEAGLCGLPIVAAELEGIRDVVRDGENGRLVPSGDAARFAAAILELRSDRAGLAAASRAAAAYTEAHFTWPRIADRFVEIFAERAAAVRPARPAARAG